MYPPNYRRDDDSTCPGCGIDMEVIGPPGPVHHDGCPYRNPVPDECEFEVLDFEDGDFSRPIATRRHGKASGSCSRADCCRRGP